MGALGALVEGGQHSGGGYDAEQYVDENTIDSIVRSPHLDKTAMWRNNLIRGQCSR